MLVAAGAVQLAVSVTLLLVASTAPARLPKWGGPFDVGVAFSLVVTLALLERATASRVGLPVLRAGHRVVSTLPALVFLALWMFSDRLIWNTLLPGLAWRSFVVLTAIPAAVAAWTTRSDSARSSSAPVETP
jgi:hypothetical protein